MGHETVTLTGNTGAASAVDLRATEAATAARLNFDFDPKVATM